jgi:hypothetical protein
MEINITQLFQSDDYTPMDYSASIAELGNNAGKITWNNAMEGPVFLDTPEKIEALREYVKGFGAWSDEEIATWNGTECNALFLQFVSGDIREAGLDTDSPDWKEYESNDSINHNIFLGDDGNIYYYLGS